MRKMSVIISRVRAGLFITEDEGLLLRNWLARKQEAQNRFVNMALLVAAVMLVGSLLSTLG